MKVLAEQGRVRTDSDGCRRYLPISLSFDTRAYILGTDIEERWDEQVKAQWRQNKQSMSEHLIHQYGADGFDRKITDFVDLDKAPWTVIAPHVPILNDIRRSFIAGAHYSALLGAAGLGERILNDLVLQLRDAFAGHPATKRIAKKKSFDNWPVMAETLKDWGILDAGVTSACIKFAELRNSVVHFRPDKNIHVRSAALQAMGHLSQLIEHVFAPMGRPPRFIAGTTGHSFLSLDAESHPLIQLYFIPNSVLVSPDFEFRDSLTSIYDEQDYPSINDVQTLTDAEFAQRRS
ncbi:MAG: hypothetical protein ACRDRH_24065 [Pseudonocardia sp.]